MRFKDLSDQEQKVIDALGSEDIDKAREAFLKWQQLRNDFLQFLLAEFLHSESTTKKKMTKQEYSEATKNRPKTRDTGNAYNLDQIPTDKEIKNQKK